LNKIHTRSLYTLYNVNRQHMPFNVVKINVIREARHYSLCKNIPLIVCELQYTLCPCVYLYAFYDKYVYNMEN
jgi:hypothetical protein